MGSSTMEKLSHSSSGQVISWCPSCYVQYTETILPTVERQRGSRPFEMNPFMRFLADRLAQLKPHLQRRVEMRVALHLHPGVAGVVEAATEILKMVPGIEIVDLNQPAVGLQSVNVGVFRSSSANCSSWNSRRRAMRASMHWLRYIIPIIANCARTSATGHSAS